jgi:hypothetical protein
MDLKISAIARLEAKTNGCNITDAFIFFVSPITKKAKPATVADITYTTVISNNCIGPSFVQTSGYSVKNQDWL